MSSPRRAPRSITITLVISVAAAVAIAAGAPSTALGSEDKPSFPAKLEQLRVRGSMLVAADQDGNVGAWDSAHKLIGRWDRRGKLAESCVLGNPTIPPDAASFAISGDHALLSFFDAAAEKEGGRRELIVDLRKCEVISSFAVKGIATLLIGAPDGWVQTSSPDELQSGRFKLAILDDEGKTVDELEVDHQLGQVVKEKKFSAPLGPYDFRPFVVDNEVWVIPSAVYELWRPRQHGKPFRKMAPPKCLAAQGQELTGTENVEHVLALSRNWPEEVRKSIERGAKSGGLSPSFLSPTSYIAVWDRFVAVQVRDWKETGSERIDVWNTDTESIVAVLGIPGTARLIAFNEGGLWVKVDDGRLVRLAVPDLWPEKFDPCAAVEVLKENGVGPTSTAATPTPAAGSPAPASGTPTPTAAPPFRTGSPGS